MTRDGWRADTALTRRALLAAAGGIGLATAGGWATPAAGDNAFFKSFGGTVSEIPGDWPKPGTPTLLTEGYLGSLRLGTEHDVPLTELKGSWVIHITVLGNYLNSLLDSYETSGRRQPVNLARVVTTMDALLARASRRRGGVFLKYEFPWHSYQGDLPDPWYSSFGQSKFPLVTQRLYEYTGERRWLQATSELVTAFFQAPQIGQTDLPWIATVDPNHYLWLDEYPQPDGRASAVFNGHYYAMVGLLRYQARTGDARAKKLVQGAAETMAAYRNLCRHPGTFSHYYASNSAHVASYHYVNASCYLNMYNHTGWSPFAHTVDQMIGDWRVSSVPTTVFAKGGYPHSVRPVTGSAGVNAGAATVWRPSRDVVVSSGTRSQWSAFPGVWSRMDSGPMKGYWIRETVYGYPEGFHVDRAEYRFPRDVWFEPGTSVSFVADSRGHLSSPRYSVFKTRSRAQSTLRAKLGGSHYARIDNGGLAGRWARLSSVTHY
ncbi:MULTISPECIES: D-glucuronyl C5-epimerase family protein [Aestuariimicrobium]|uniref:D-glucuronyl C5-epimerase family protein n=1 Tax=Aestuariimicrobium TaxID=396388 RepID=UPI0003B6CDA9|nr:MULTISPECIES: D-glucuronyl C5-epimerase family protein [Aestuariimicrobium]CAI9400717.1 hypothetical protein AESSP_00445 [Aestuariimicrobium sp. T2.26MG-19.2B]